MELLHFTAQPDPCGCRLRDPKTRIPQSAPIDRVSKGMGPLCSIREGLFGNDLGAAKPHRFRGIALRIAAMPRMLAPVTKAMARQFFGLSSASIECGDGSRSRFSRTMKLKRPPRFAQPQ
jgi:hypothetical protein